MSDPNEIDMDDPEDERGASSKPPRSAEEWKWKYPREPREMSEREAAADNAGVSLYGEL